MNIKKGIIQKILIAVTSVIVINWVASSVYSRLDLTEDNRYTLSETTKDYIANLNDTIRFSVYLDGDLPVSFNKMKQEVSDLLDEIKRLGGSKIQILFIDPLAIGNEAKANKQAFDRLMQYGLKPYTIQDQDENGKLTQRNIIPGIIISTTNRYVPINLFSEALSNTTEGQINEALSQLEYLCLKGITQLTTIKKKNIAFLIDHKELSFNRCFDVTMALMETYNIDRISTQELLDSITKYDALVIAKPQSEFSDRDKFILDQYLMRDGNLIGLFDMVQVNADTLKYVSETSALYNDLNMSDFLFNLGVRINPEIILDNQCALIPLNASQPGMAPRYEPAPWFYYPILRGNMNQPHLIHNKLDAIKAEFANSLDTVEGNGTLEKTILLTTSAYSKKLGVPTEVGFNILKTKPTADFWKNPYIPVAALVEGQLESIFKTRSAPKDLPANFEVLHRSKQNKIIIVADGDIIKNEIEVNGYDSIPKPLHYYKYFKIDKRIYTGNKEFFLNAVNYICGDTALIPLRSREMKIRLLNKNRILEEKANWQFLNIVVPILLLILSGFIILIVRKRKYTKHVS